MTNDVVRSAPDVQPLTTSSSISPDGETARTQQQTAVEEFRKFAEENLGETVTIGLLPSEGGVSMQIVTGVREFTSLNRQTRRVAVPLDILYKDKSQNKAYGGLCGLSSACDTAGLALPIVDVRAGEPDYVGKDGEFWIYSLSVKLKIII